MWKRAENLKNRRHTHKKGNGNWESTYRKEHNLCSNSECRNEIRRKCLAKRQKVLEPKSFKLTDCLFPINMANIFQEQPPNPWPQRPRKKSTKCWNLPNTKEIFQCLKSRRKSCKIQLKVKKPNWTMRKVAKKCHKKFKIEKCMAERRQLFKRLRRKKKWNRKRARQICQKRNSH